MQDTVEEELPLTRGLEALLGGLGELENTAPAAAAAIEQDAAVPEAPAVHEVQVQVQAQVPTPALSTKTGSTFTPNPIIPGLFLGGYLPGISSGAPSPVVADDERISEYVAPTPPATAPDAPIEESVCTHLEQEKQVLLNSPVSIPGNIPSPAKDAPMQVSTPESLEKKSEAVPEIARPNVENTPAAAEDTRMSEVPLVEAGPPVDGVAPAEDEHPEWEIDSSPIESSSEESSDDSSSDESDEGDNAYKLMSPEEQARILMEGDGGSDDEGASKSKGTGTQLRTKNEVPDVVVPKPDVTITPEMPIVEVGNVEHIVESTLVIKAKTSGEFRCLESGSVLCLEDRSVIGVVAEILGPVQKPLYSVMFTNAGEIAQAGLSLGTKVFYSEKHSTFVFTQALKAFKGSDASNLHDEEVGDEEMEFSDDEAEAEHKRRVKQKKIERRGGKAPNGGPSRGGHPLQQQHTPHDSSTGLSYDDAEDDGPYRPLARPIGFENSIGCGEAPQEGLPGSYERPPRDNFRARGRGGDRGRGDRARGRGDRGRGRGGYQDRRGGGQNRNSGHTLPPRPQTYTQSPASYPPSQYQQPAPKAINFSQAPPAPPSIPNFFMPPAAYNPQMPWPPFPMQPPFQQQQPYQNQHPQMPWQNPSAGKPPAGGAYINPAFMPGQWGQQRPGSQGGGADGK
ncbi:hypothetical protein LZ554_002081 [Drepanopeziza brunnea f. sp. 'monogermtubi']|nr:hypothetical protein LZ554_002081 [Drepanopeziza brunnea f. sp. 'monogermtubi']